MPIYVQFEREPNPASDGPLEPVVVAVYLSPQDPEYYPFMALVEDNDPRYLAYINPGSTPTVMAAAARLQRDGLLRSIYDPGILMAQRALRLASTPEESAYAESKILELDLYAEALQGIPEQEGFPQTIQWPEEITP